MDSQTYNLLTTVLGALIPGLFGIINTIIVTRSKRTEKIATTPTADEPTKPMQQRRSSHTFLLVGLIIIGTAIGFYIGNATKKSPSIVKLYNQDEQTSVSMERIAEIDREIFQIDQERIQLMEQPTISEPEKEKIMRSHDERINQLTMEKAEFENIIGMETENGRIKELERDMELKSRRQIEAEAEINRLEPYAETDPDARNAVENLRGEVILLQQEKNEIEHELLRLEHR